MITIRVEGKAVLELQVPAGSMLQVHKITLAGSELPIFPHTVFLRDGEELRIEAKRGE